MLRVHHVNDERASHYRLRRGSGDSITPTPASIAESDELLLFTHHRLIANQKISAFFDALKALRRERFFDKSLDPGLHELIRKLRVRHAHPTVVFVTGKVAPVVVVHSNP